MTIEQQSRQESQFVVVDIEGNGRNPPEIVEIALVLVRSGKIFSQRNEWLVRPVQSIDDKVIQIHGITNAMVSDKPTFSDIAPAVQAKLADDYFVAHQARVDFEILKRALPTWKPKGIIDTLSLARQFLPGRKSYALGSLAKELGLSTEIRSQLTRPHRAAYDALVTARLFCYLEKDESGISRPLSNLLSSQPSQDMALSCQKDLF